MWSAGVTTHKSVKTNKNYKLISKTNGLAKYFCCMLCTNKINIEQLTEIVITLDEIELGSGKK